MAQREGTASIREAAYYDRYRRVDLGHLEVETTIDDPGAYSRPWTLKWVADLRPDDDIVESICNENNRDVEHLIGK